MDTMTSNLVLIGLLWCVFGVAATLTVVAMQHDNPHLVKLPFWANCIIGFLVPVGVVLLPVIIPVAFVVCFFVSIYRSVFPRRKEVSDD